MGILDLRVTSKEEASQAQEKSKYYKLIFHRTWNKKSPFIENLHAYRKYEKIDLNQDEICLWKLIASHI